MSLVAPWFNDTYNAAENLKIMLSGYMIYRKSSDFRAVAHLDPDYGRNQPIVTSSSLTGSLPSGV